MDQAARPDGARSSTPRAAARPSGAGQGVLLGVLVQAGHAGLGQVIADGGVHRGFLCVACWRCVPRMRLIDILAPREQLGLPAAVQLKHV
jgi:hypothetical protein